MWCLTHQWFEIHGACLLAHYILHDGGIYSVCAWREGQCHHQSALVLTRLLGKAGGSRKAVFPLVLWCSWWVTFVAHLCTEDEATWGSSFVGALLLYSPLLTALGFAFTLFLLSQIRTDRYSSSPALISKKDLAWLRTFPSKGPTSPRLSLWSSIPFANVQMQIKDFFF